VKKYKKLAIKQKGYSIKFIKDPSEEVQEYIWNNNPENRKFLQLDFVKNK